MNYKIIKKKGQNIDTFKIVFITLCNYKEVLKEQKVIKGTKKQGPKSVCRIRQSIS